MPTISLAPDLHPDGAFFVFFGHEELDSWQAPTKEIVGGIEGRTMV
jgi:hypothetical protein